MVESKSKPIEDKLHQAWRQQRRYYNVRGVSRFLIWLVFLVALDFLIDWGIFFQVRMTTRLGVLLLAINVIVLACVLWYEWLRYLKPYDPLLVALDVESRHPELASLLVSYTQIKGPLTNQPDVSVELIEAMREQAVLHTHKLDFREIVDFGQLRKLLLVAGCILLGFGAVSFSNQEHVRALFKRLAGIEATYPTRTQVEDVTGNLTVRMGDAASVVARAAGVIPKQGQILTRPADGSAGWKSLPLKKRSNQPTFEREFKDIVKDLEYQVRIGDDRSKTFRIDVVPAPQITSTKVDLRYPRYMDKEPGEADQLNLEVPEGTEITWHLSCDTAIKRLVVQIEPVSSDASESKVIEADITDESRKTMTFGLVADQAFKYTFRWTERESGKEFEYDDVQHHVRVVADAVPEVDLIRPGSDGLATVTKTFNLTAVANDDHGLDKAWLVYSLDGSKEHSEPIHDFKGSRSQEFNYAWELAKSIEGLKPGVQIEFAVEVGDRNPAALEHRRRSATRAFAVVDLRRYLQWQSGEFASQLDEVKRVRDRELSASTKVKQLREQESDTP